MEKKPKLKRLPRCDGYATGDAQDWTYEYTWEDFQEAEKYLTPKPGTDFHRLILEIYAYFEDCPEKLREGGKYADDETCVAHAKLLMTGSKEYLRTLRV